MTDLEGVQQRLDQLIEGRYQDKEEILKALYEIKEEIIGVRIEVTQALSSMADKIDQNYVRKDVNDGKDKEHDTKIADLQTAQGAAKADHLALRTRIDRFAIVGATAASTIAIFKKDLAEFIRFLLP